MLNRFRELAKSFGSQDEPEKTQQLKRTKEEVEKNVTRILKLIKNNEEQGKGKRKTTKRETELVGLVENFYKEYESLHAFCYELVAKSTKRRAVNENETERSSDPGSDTEYHSSEETDINIAKFESEIARLKRELATLSEENKALRSKCDSALLKEQEVENAKAELKIDVDKKRREILALANAHESNRKLSSTRIKELEGQLQVKSAEAKQIGDKRKGLHSRVLELELVLKEKEEQNSSLVKKLEEIESKFVSRIEDLAAQKRSMQSEIDSLRDKKSELENSLVVQKIELEAQLERESVAILSNSELRSEKIVSVETITKNGGKVENSTLRSNGSEENTSALLSKKGESELPSTPEIENSRINLNGKTGVDEDQQGFERKVIDLAENFRGSLENKLDLLSRRILVTEYMHNEAKEGFKATKKRYEKANRELEEKIKGYESEFKKIKEVSKLAQYALDGLDSVVRKFEERNGYFSNRISRVSNELKHAKRWVKGSANEIKRLKHNVDCLVAYLEHEKEQELLLRDKIWKLEAKVSKESGEKLNLLQEISQQEKKIGKYERLVKEKDERLLSLGEEKREVIRQLCVSVDYHRSQVDHLKLVIARLRMKHK